MHLFETGLPITSVWVMFYTYVCVFNNMKQYDKRICTASLQIFSSNYLVVIMQTVICELELFMENSNISGSDSQNV